jgi:hypothetical protein
VLTAEKKGEKMKNQGRVSRKVIDESLSRRKRVVDKIEVHGVTYLSMLVPCGRKWCKKCPHGPYWYAVKWHKQKRKEIYIGREFKTLVQFDLERKVARLEKIKEEEVREK